MERGTQQQLTGIVGGGIKPLNERVVVVPLEFPGGDDMKAGKAGEEGAVLKELVIKGVRHLRVLLLLHLPGRHDDVIVQDSKELNFLVQFEVMFLSINLKRKRKKKRKGKEKKSGENHENRERGNE